MKLELYDVDVSYGNKAVLRGLSLGEIWGEQVRGIVGDNGSGKSTLLRTIAGRLPSECQWRARILVDGHDISDFYTRRLARHLGIFLIPQDPSLVSTISVLDNIWLGAEETVLGLFRRSREQRRKVETLLSALNWTIPLDSSPEELTLRDQQKVSIVRGLVRKPTPRLLLFDEPTTHLSPEDRNGILRELRKIAARGLGIMIVSHRPSDLLTSCDTISIIEQGRVRDTLGTKDRTPEALIAELYGPPSGETPSDDTFVKRKWEVALDVKFPRHEPASRELAPSLRFQSENGTGPFVTVTKQSQDGDSLFDLLTGWGSRTRITGEALLGRRSLFELSTAEIRRLGFGLVPSRKVSRGICLELTVHENIILVDPSLRFIWSEKARERVAVLARKFGLQERLEDRARDLSGGLQQRCLLAREFGYGSGGIFMREPTQGLDYDSREALVVDIKRINHRGVLTIILTADPDDLHAKQGDVVRVEV